MLRRVCIVGMRGLARRAVTPPLCRFARILTAGAATAADGSRAHAARSQAPEMRVAEVKLQAMGESVTDATIGDWKVKPGDHIQQFELLCTCETDKITVDVTSPYAGKIVKLLARPGEQVKIGAPIVLIETAVDDSHAKWSARSAKAMRMTGESAPIPTRPAPAAAMRAEEVTTSMRVATPGGGRLPEPRERRFGKYKVAQGDRLMVWDTEGRAEVVAGPAQLILSGHAVQPLKDVTASPGEYLVITYLDGRIEHRNGPCEETFNSTIHASVTVQKSLQLNSNEAIVVYRPTQVDKTKDTDGGIVVQQHIIHGPAVYFSHPNEWVHSFLWHGGRQRFRFIKLRTLPDQMPITVDHVRTLDDALVEVKLVVFFELTDIETMLRTCSDPLAEFANSVAADIIRFASARKLDGLRTAAEELNKLDAYAMLTGRSSGLGFAIRRVLFKGFTTRSELSLSQESSLMTKTKLQLALESEAKNQDVKDLVLERTHSRAVEQMEMQREQTEHEIAMKAIQHSNLLTEQRERNKEEVAQAAAENTAFLEYVRRLRDLNVPLTDFLVSHARAGGAVAQPTSIKP